MAMYFGLRFPRALSCMNVCCGVFPLGVTGFFLLLFFLFVCLIGIERSCEHFVKSLRNFLEEKNVQHEVSLETI